MSVRADSVSLLLRTAFFGQTSGLAAEGRDGYIHTRDMLWRSGDASLLEGFLFSHGDGSKRLRPAKRSGQPAMEGVATTDSGQADHVWTSSGN